jgi:hypothetical protein
MQNGNMVGRIVGGKGARMAPPFSDNKAPQGLDGTGMTVKRTKGGPKQTARNGDSLRTPAWNPPKADR